MVIKCWLGSSLKRYFPLSSPEAKRSFVIHAAQGERISFQVCIFNGGKDPVPVAVSKEPGSPLPCTIRRIGFVPVLHHNTDTPEEELDGVGHIPGYVPDPLFPEQNAVIPPGEIISFWVTVDVPCRGKKGIRKVLIKVNADKKGSFILKASVCVSDIVLKKRRDFSVTHWFYADSLCDWYKVKPFERPFWDICEQYMKDYAAHGCDTIYVPVFTPPLDGVKRPTQLVGVKRLKKDTYSFDWHKVKKWVRLAKRCGIRKFEWTHLFTQWGCRYAIRIYEKQKGKDCLLWHPNTGATSRTYRRFLEQFLPSFERFLNRERLMRASYFHVSDEPHKKEHLENYRKARSVLKEVAPWMKVMDALSDIRFASEGLTDMPVPIITKAKTFAQKGIPSWTYFCCNPGGKYLTRLMDTPLAKIRMSGWLFYRFGFKGFLHWGYNYWYKSQTRKLIDPFTVSDGHAWPGWAYGDTFVVYPGPKGPVDSIRWEVFAESMQDYALLQTLGVDPHSRLLSGLKDLDDFPKHKEWIEKTRKKLLKRI